MDAKEQRRFMILSNLLSSVIQYEHHKGTHPYAVLRSIDAMVAGVIASAATDFPASWEECLFAFVAHVDDLLDSVGDETSEKVVKKPRLAYDADVAKEHEADANRIATRMRDLAELEPNPIVMLGSLEAVTALVMTTYSHSSKSRAKLVRMFTDAVLNRLSDTRDAVAACLESE